MRPLNTKHLVATGLGVIGLLALTAWPAVAEDRPESQPGHQVPENIPQIEQDIPDDLKRPAGPELLQELERAPRSTDDRGGLYVDAGEGREYPGANPLELTKLEAARTAVEVSRAAGTLFTAPPLAMQIPDDPEQHKLERLRALQPTPVVHPDGSGVVDAPTARQEAGPTGLNAHEQAKLNGDLVGAPRTETPETAQPGKTDVPAEASGQREGGR